MPEVKGRSRKEPDFAWVHDLERALASNDSGGRFEALKSIKSYDSRPILRESRVLQQLLQCAGEEQPIHVRAQVFEILGELGDPNFWYYIDPFLLDKNEHVVVKAIGALASLGESPASEKIVSILISSKSRIIQTACLKHLAKVSLNSETGKLTLLSACISLESQTPNDMGLTLMVTEAMANQVSWKDDEVIEFVSSRLMEGDNRNRLAALDNLRRNSEEYYQSPKSRNLLAEAIKSCISAEDHRVQASALAFCLLAKDALFQFQNNVEFWKAIRLADRWTVHQLFEIISAEYRAQALFDAPGDCRNLLSLVGKFDVELDELIMRILQEIGNSECMEILSQCKIRVEGWTRLNILCNMLKADEWKSYFDDILSLMDNDFSQPWQKTVHLLYFLANFRSNKISIDELIDSMSQAMVNFDKSDSDSDEMKLIIQELESIRSKSKDIHKRKITQIIATMAK